MFISTRGSAGTPRNDTGPRSSNYEESDMSVQSEQFHLALAPSRKPRWAETLLTIALMAAGGFAIADHAAAAPESHEPRDGNPVSPARDIHRQLTGHSEAPRSQGRARSADRERTIDGSLNNPLDGEIGAAETRLLRRFESDYADGISSLAGPARPSPRTISNAVHTQLEDLPNELFASDFLWQWGQFLDHDIDLTDGVDPPEPANISVPSGDPYFDPANTGTQEIALNRSIWDESTGTDTTNPREQLNEITAWIDASNVYGSDETRAAALRAGDGTGRLATSEGNLLPFNTAGLPNAGGSAATLFLAGDVRANEQVGLIAMHTLFVREHNRIVDELAVHRPELDGDQLYAKARQLVGAQIQSITYREFLPVLLGRGTLARYRGYDANVDATIANAFSTAAYRFGHSALSPTLLRLTTHGQEIAEGHLPLRDAFFSPGRVVNEGGIDPILRGLAAQTCQRIDAHVIDDVRNFLFGPPGGGGFDLASLNIQRGRDHGLPSYNDARRELGLDAVSDFADINADPAVHEGLASVYTSVEDIDLFTGGLSEPAAEGGHLGELFSRIVAEQFEALRDGDRFWYERTLSPAELDQIDSRRLSDVIRENTEIRDELPDNVFQTGRVDENQKEAQRKADRQPRTRR